MRTEQPSGGFASRLRAPASALARHGVAGWVVCLVAAPLLAENGDVLSVSSVLAGKDLSAITSDPANSPLGGSFWALGKLTGRIYHVSLDLTTVLGDIPNPHGTGAIPNFILSWGLASRPLTKTLFILAHDAGAWRVREVKTDGTEVVAGAFTITPPDGASADLRSLAYDSIAREFWYLDANNDKIVRTGTDGVATKVCPLPGDAPPETTIRGDGLCFELTQLADQSFEQRLYVSYGDIFRRNPSRIIQIADSCQETGIEIPLARLTLPEVPQGFQTFRLAAQRRVAVVTSEGKIAQLEQVVPGPVPPSQLRCALTLTNKVALEWQNNGTLADRSYGGEVILLRNGVPFNTLPGATTQFTDDTPLEGTSTYSLRATESSGGPASPAGHPCEVTVGTGGIVRWIPFPGIRPFDAARNPSTGDIYVTDNVGLDGQGNIYVYDATLGAIGEISSPWQRPGPIAFLPAIKISGIDFQDLLAVGRTDGSLVKLMDLAGNEKTTIVLEGSAGAGSLTFIPSTQQFVFTAPDPASGSTLIHVNDSTGRALRTCVPLDLFNLPEIDAGITYDPIRDTFLTAFKDGVVRELYTAGSCAPTLPEFDIFLGSLGEGYNEPGFLGGIQIAANTLIACGRASNAIFQVLIFPAGPPFKRGDFDRNDAVNLTDAVASARYLFQAGAAPPCQDAADTNDDGVLDVSDPVYLLFHLFLQGPPPPAPFPGAGQDPTFRDNLGCEEKSS